MTSTRLDPGVWFRGITVGGSGGRLPVPVVIITILLLVMGIITVFHSANPMRGASSTKTPYKCVECGAEARYTGMDLRNLPPDAVVPDAPPGTRGPALRCPKCGKLTMVEAHPCAKCGAVFVVRRDPKTHQVIDTCPTCGTKVEGKAQFLPEPVSAPGK